MTGVPTEEGFRLAFVIGAAVALLALVGALAVFPIDSGCAPTDR
ncbi:hypothetical protein AB0C27_09605 [Nonomuraea sp. NPDC048882]